MDCVNERGERRVAQGLSQAAAATRADVSLATYRRWEENPDSVSAKTRSACAAVLGDDGPFAADLRRSADAFTAAWSDSAVLTPRQAYALALALDMWADGELHEWLRDPASAPLHDVGPFARFDRRVMFHVGESRAFADATADRCRALSQLLEQGTLPFEQPGCLMDEVLMGAALHDAQTYLSDMRELFEAIAERRAVETDDEYLPGDTDWDFVSDTFDDNSRWDEWEVPTMLGHHHLPAILRARHPYTWFDEVPATGPGYLHNLDMATLHAAEQTDAA